MIRKLARPVTQIASSADGNLVMTVSGPEAMIWSGEALDRVGVPLRTRGNSISAACNRYCGRIVTWGQDDAARVWDPATGEQVLPPLTSPRDCKPGGIQPGWPVSGDGQLRRHRTALGPGRRALARALRYAMARTSCMRA